MEEKLLTKEEERLLREEGIEYPWSARAFLRVLEKYKTRVAELEKELEDSISFDNHVACCEEYARQVLKSEKAIPKFMGDQTAGAIRSIYKDMVDQGYLEGPKEKDPSHNEMCNVNLFKDGKCDCEANN